ncbi:scarecrow-like protein 4 [Pyrus ussuriensis x Pyrus communis]|uniref:Scarecrow-like protein 4 n=1 Tax=Pyrus ussuriensis x Pyrus communis TaxID=2448454 RepID=A0A5N5G4R3_9ROSA|nr:scarecrow-like protein 4 [Pyrus ussuriensis x Pyrus communis]
MSKKAMSNRSQLFGPSGMMSYAWDYLGMGKQVIDPWVGAGNANLEKVRGGYIYGSRSTPTPLDLNLEFSPFINSSVLLRFNNHFQPSVLDASSRWGSTNSLCQINDLMAWSVSDSVSLVHSCWQLVLGFGEYDSVEIGRQRVSVAKLTRAVGLKRIDAIETEINIVPLPRVWAFLLG